MLRLWEHALGHTLCRLGVKENPLLPTLLVAVLHCIGPMARHFSKSAISRSLDMAPDRIVSTRDPALITAVSSWPVRIAPSTYLCLEVDVAVVARCGVYYRRVVAQLERHLAEEDTPCVCVWHLATNVSSVRTSAVAITASLDSQ